MKHTNKMVIVFALTMVLLLSSCATAPVTVDSQPTVQDIFATPTATVPTGSTGTTIDQPNEPATTEPNIGTEVGLTSFGPSGGDKLSDEYGVYRVYEGGQMCIPFKLKATGQMAMSYTQQGIGILVFLDGQAQPYRLEENGELSYCHILYPEFDFTNTYYFDMYFTPVTGEEGEMVEFYTATIINPNWQSTDPMTGWRYTFGSVAGRTRLKMNATPSEAERPVIKERMSTVDITYEDATFQEIGHWTDEELIKNYQSAWYIDGTYPAKTDYFLYDYSARSSVELQFVLWGTPYVQYGLMFYVDNQPISAQQEILFDNQAGQKTIITVTIDLSDFDGECVVYAALIPRNAVSTEIETNAYLSLSLPYFLLDDPEPEK